MAKRKNKQSKTRDWYLDYSILICIGIIIGYAIYGW